MRVQLIASCKLVPMTNSTLASIIILITFLGAIGILTIGMICWKRINDYTVLIESGAAKSLLWSYANELMGENIESNNASEERPKICINSELEEPGDTEPELIDVRPVYSQTNCSEFSYNAKRST